MGSTIVGGFKKGMAGGRPHQIEVRAGLNISNDNANGNGL